MPDSKLIPRSSGRPATGPRKEFLVRFNREIADTVNYIDGQGCLVFVYDTLRRIRALALHTHPFEHGEPVRVASAEAKARLDRARERVKDFLEARGYSVSSVESSFKS